MSMETRIREQDERVALAIGEMDRRASEQAHILALEARVAELERRLFHRVCAFCRGARSRDGYCPTPGCADSEECLEAEMAEECAGK